MFLVRLQRTRGRFPNPYVVEGGRPITQSKNFYLVAYSQGESG